MFVRKILKRCLFLNLFYRNKHVYVDQQPTYFTHPHLLKQNELTSGITKQEYIDRREKLQNIISHYLRTQSQMFSEENFCIFLPSSTRINMGPDVLYQFKQQSDFLYFTGCLQHDCCLLLTGKTTQNDGQFKTYLFLSERQDDDNEYYSRWFGSYISDKVKISSMYNIDHIYSINDLQTFINKSKRNYVLFYDKEFAIETNLNQKLLNEQLMPFVGTFSTIFDNLKLFTHYMRSIKSTAEQHIMRQVCQLTSTAFIDTMKYSLPNMNEQMIQTKFQYECLMNIGVSDLAFKPVVAGGTRSNIIHYVDNNQFIKNGELILLDGGCLYKHYASDISRSWPISGRFNSEQRHLYEILLTVQKELLDICTTNMSRKGLNDFMEQRLAKYLQEEHILSRKILTEHEVKKVVEYLSSTAVSHHLGMDVHDCASIPFNEKFVSGNVITIEPGLYIPETCMDVPSGYRGLAFRIEDDVLITQNGYEVLTQSCPKEVDDLHQILDQRIK
ncbi:unnamed protein product [Didymodactylos carnosus]|uniref:Aminopeptidase P N-terminal domain-containing protein n=1 Tax=Didymodactylos carnosus TaxID=1234261 RepID=A0A8S2D569_9BILA|nr:unnamed protein product [Didymodactylos carnosus]CAF3665396.1 unnamed protein product [Didymodactylos carnosus]